MKRFRLATLLVSFAACTGFARAQDVTTLNMNDPGWVMEAGSRLARCAGTYRGAAAVMRDGGRESAANYADNVASGALFAAYLLFTSPEAIASKALDSVDPGVHIEALAWGSKRNFMETRTEPAQAELLHDCALTSSLQSAVLRSSAQVASSAAAQL